MAKKHLVRLEFIKGASAKQYTIWMEPKAKKFDVVTQWGKISDSAPEQKIKNTKPLDQADAEVLYAKVISEKIKKGYKPVKGSLPTFIKGTSSVKSKNSAKTTKKNTAKKATGKAAKKSPKKSNGKSANKGSDTTAASGKPAEFIVKYQVTIGLMYKDSGKKKYFAESAEEAEKMLVDDWDNDGLESDFINLPRNWPDNAAVAAGATGGGWDESRLEPGSAVRANSEKTRYGEEAEYIVNYDVEIYFKDVMIPGEKRYTAPSEYEAEEMLQADWDNGVVTDFIRIKLPEDFEIQASSFSVLQVVKAKK